MKLVTVVAKPPVAVLLLGTNESSARDTHLG